MSLITIAVGVILLALALWVLSVVTLDAQIKKILYVIIVVVFVLWLVTGLLGVNIGNIRIG